MPTSYNGKKQVLLILVKNVCDIVNKMVNITVRNND